jgi:hypothetical protein
MIANPSRMPAFPVKYAITAPGLSRLAKSPGFCCHGRKFGGGKIPVWQNGAAKLAESKILQFLL